jgi:hypothetical protein
MARQLIYGNDIIGFNPSVGILTAKGYVPLPKLLSIVNSTQNIAVYSFADPDTTTNVAYDPKLNQTTFDLSFETVGMGSSDQFQIYYEKEEIEIIPTRHLLDPVQKLRVSQPESLIDTDFEYGTQTTKWETVKLVNNIPTSYTSGIPEENIEALTVKVDEGNDFMVVETPEPHNLKIGSVTDIQGLKDPKYEGIFIVRDVSDANTFTIKLPFVSNKTVQLDTEFTLIFPGSFYTGSTIDVLDIETSTGAASTFRVTTENIPGIVEGTKLFLKKSRATKKYEFQSPQDVETENETLYQATISSPGPGVAITPISSVYLANLPWIEDNWIGDQEWSVPSTNWKITGEQDSGKIFIYKNEQYGNGRNIVIEPDDVVMFYTPRGNAFPGPGVSSYHPFRVTEVNPGVGYTFVSFRIAADFNDPNINFSTRGTNDFGTHRLIKANGGRIVRVDRRGTVTFDKPHGLQYGDSICFFSKWTNLGSSSVGVVTTRGNWITSLYRTYKVTGILNDKQIRVPAARFYRYWWWGWYWWWYYRFDIFRTTYFNDDRLVAVSKVVNHPLKHAIYLPQDVGFSTEGFKTAQTVLYETNLPTTGTPSQLANNTRYLIREVKDDIGRDWYQLYDFRDARLRNPRVLNTRNHEISFRTPGGFHKFTSSLIGANAFTIKITNPPRAELTNNQRLRYNTVTPTTIGGLTGQNNYFAKTDDNLIDNDRFRLANQQASVDLYAWNFSGANRPTARLTVITGAAHTAGLVRYGYAQVSGYEGIASENLMVQGIHQIVGISTSFFFYYYYTRRWRRRWRRRYWWFYWRRYKVRRREPLTYLTVSVPTVKNRLNVFNRRVTSASVKVCGIVSFTSRGGIGTHSITIDTDGAADDTYTVKDVESISTGFEANSFTFQSTVEVPEVINVMSGGDSTRVGVGSNWIKIIDHKLADGTKITYRSNGFAVISPLVDGQDYFVRTLDGDHIGLSSSQELAINRFNDIDNTDLIAYTSFGSTTNHQFISKSIKGFITGPGTIGIGTESDTVTGKDTNFYTDFSAGDRFRMYKLSPTPGPGSYFESRIVQVKSNTVIKLEDEPDFEDESANYFIPTRLYAVSDSKVIHRPFDGAVQLVAGLVPNSQLIRQTRKYFRYQAGKGIQCSMAINFNPTYDIEKIQIDGEVGISTDIIVTTKWPHGISTEAPFDDDQKFQILNATYPEELNGIYPIEEVIDDFNIRVQTPEPLNDPKFEGFPVFNVVNWRDGFLKCGMFDDQNGFFFQFDGDKLSVVRRSNTQQLAGSFTCEKGEHLIRGSGSRLKSQVREFDRIIIRGQTYKVIEILDNDLMYVQPAYRSKTLTNVTASKVIDTIVPQNEWNIDRMDGTGVSGYQIDTNRIQMLYMDYSWYGAGTVRFGMKTQDGTIKYCHEFIHNNQFTEAYFRSGNLPVRYEVETLDDPFFSPSIYHWGVSVIMDGRFDQDRVYHFSADSKVLPFTNGGIANFNGTVPTGRTSIGSTEVWNINRTEGQTLVVGEEVTGSTTGVFEQGTRITAIEIDTTSLTNRFRDNYRVFMDKEALVSRTTNFAFYAFSGTAETLKEFIPLVSIRLAPSADNSTTGNIGYREIINRMQILLKEANVLTTHDCEVALVVNPKLSNEEWEEVGSPSLSQYAQHEVGDTYTSGQVVYSFRAQGGSSIEGTTLKRGLNGTTVDLNGVATLGNSVLGGDGIYPDGPDVLTLAVKPIDTALIRGSSPFLVSGRITWIETQA